MEPLPDLETVRDFIERINDEQDNAVRKDLLTRLVHQYAEPPVIEFCDWVLALDNNGVIVDDASIGVFVHNGNLAMSLTYVQPSREQLDSAYMIGEHKC